MNGNTTGARNKKKYKDGRNNPGNKKIDRKKNVKPITNSGIGEVLIPGDPVTLPKFFKNPTIYSIPYDTRTA